jgi:hypothetical protein
MYPNSGFSNNGAKPFYPTPTGTLTGQLATMDKLKPINTPIPQYNGGQTPNYNNPMGAIPGLLNSHPTAPTNNNVASHTVTTAPDGTKTTKQTYTPPTGTPNSSTPPATPPAPVASTTPPATPPVPGGTPTPSTGTPTPPGTVGNTTGTQIGNVGGAGQLTNLEGGTLGGLIGQSQNPSQAYTGAQQTYQGLLDQYQKDLGTYNTQIAGQAQRPGVLSGFANNQSAQYAAEHGGQLQAEAAALQAGLGAVGQANTQQGLQVQAGQAALGGAQTQANRNLGAQESVLGAVQPQPYGITTTPYNPATGNYGTLAGAAAGSGGITGAGSILGQLSGAQGVAQQTVANQAILGKVQAQLPGLTQAIQADNFNPTSVTSLNQLQDWAKGNLSDSAIPEIQGSLNDIVGGLSQVLGVPSSGGSDFRLQFAGSIVNALQQGQSIEQAVQFATNQAVAGVAGYYQGGTQGMPTGEGETVTSGGYNFKKVNGRYEVQA